MTSRPSIGVSAIALHEPGEVRDNAWFGAAMPRKFLHHTGTRARNISHESELQMARHAIEQLRREVQVDFKDCSGVIFVSPSFVPRSIARKLLPAQAWKEESLALAARTLARSLGLPERFGYGLNWFCSGYAKALAVASRRFARLRTNHRDQFLLVVTAGRISRITDYDCPQTGPLFGDLAAVTLLSRVESRKYPVHLRLNYAAAEQVAAPGVYFDYEQRKASPAQGEQDISPVVFRLDGLGIADTAPRAMAGALKQALTATGLAPEAIKIVAPHQAGTGIVRLASMKFDELGIQGRVINDITGRVGNVSSSSVPFALKTSWNDLEGVVACPVAGVGPPGKPQVTQGCLIFETRQKRRHELHLQPARLTHEPLPTPDAALT